MNIFVTDDDPAICAMQHCDIHLRKMILETAQLLSTAHYVIHNESPATKPTHINHPCSVWIRESESNYDWALSLFENLLGEYRFRFDKPHTFEKHFDALVCIPEMPDWGLTKFAQAMPEEFRGPQAPAAYQRYLTAKFAEWQGRPRPLSVTYTRRDVPAFLTH